jgi:hypothetical protein
MHASFIGPVLIALVVTVATPAVCPAQERSTVQIGQEQLTTYAKAYLAIGQVRDQVQAELAQSKNKTPEAQQQLREKLRQQIGQILADNKMTEEQYRRITYVISIDPDQRKAFEEILAQLKKE